MPLHAAGAVYKHDNIVAVVLNTADALLLGKCSQEITDGLGIAGAVRDGAKLLEIPKHGLGLQPGQLSFTHNICTPFRGVR